MLVLMCFHCASITIGGIEQTHRIGQSQSNLGELRTKGATASEIWAAVLADELLHTRAFRSALIANFCTTILYRSVSTDQTARLDRS
jgi:hypothetical protein